MSAIEPRTQITDVRTVGIPVTDQDRALAFYRGGTRGGQIVFTGTPAGILKADRSLTGEYLRRGDKVAA